MGEVDEKATGVDWFDVFAAEGNVFPRNATAWLQEMFMRIILIYSMCFYIYCKTISKTSTKAIKKIDVQQVELRNNEH